MRRDLSAERPAPLFMDFRDRSVIVTGGASGIGACAVDLLMQAGACVTIADVRRPEDHDSMAASNRVQYLHTDVADATSVREMVDGAVSRFGPLHGAINAAGVPQAGKPLADVDIEVWDRCHSINLRGMFLSMKYELQAMLTSGGGAIVAVASTASLNAVPNSADYCASKAGILGLVRGAALDYADKGVRINALLPGATWTPMVQQSLSQDPSLADTVVAKFPMKRFAQPAEIAAHALWLLSDTASYVTGAAWVVDGGLSIV